MKSASVRWRTRSLHLSMEARASFLACSVAARDAAPMSLSTCLQVLSEIGTGGGRSGARSAVAHPANATSTATIRECGLKNAVPQNEVDSGCPLTVAYVRTHRSCQSICPVDLNGLLIAQ